MIYKKQLQEQGYYVLRNVIKNTSELRTNVNNSFLHHYNIQEKNFENSETKPTKGLALNCLADTIAYQYLLQDLIEIGFISDIEKNYFGSKCILNSFSALNNLPNNPNFSVKPHRDIKFYSGNIPLMLNVVLMLDDFTIENGATKILPKSHLKDEFNKEQWDNESIQITGKAGDMLIFNSNVFHASEVNHTEIGRRCIAITFSKSCIKQLADYPTMINGYLNEQVKSLVGHDSKVPISIDEFYQPDNKRAYKKGQD